jgi:hypothetical protein
MSKITTIEELNRRLELTTQISGLGLYKPKIGKGPRGYYLFITADSLLIKSSHSSYLADLWSMYRSSLSGSQGEVDWRGQKYEYRFYSESKRDTFYIHLSRN